MPDVVMLPAKVLVPLTVRLEVPVLLMTGLAPNMLNACTVMAFCPLNVALSMVNVPTPKLLVLVTTKVPPLIVVGPCELVAVRVNVPAPNLVNVNLAAFSPEILLLTVMLFAPPIAELAFITMAPETDAAVVLPLIKAPKPPTPVP